MPDLETCSQDLSSPPEFTQAEQASEKPIQIVKQRTPRWKRSFDVVSSLILLILLAPLLLALGLYIKLVSKGPVLYIQPRVGFGGETFRIMKFRTMHDRKQMRDEVHREYVANLAANNEVLEKPDIKSELILGGGLLRALSVDELPQLWNVLKGEMSLVGPRPDLLELEDYTEEQLRRFEVLPGITGLWQVNDKNDLTFTDMIDLDIEYIDTRTLLLDIKILFGTAFGMLKLSNS